MSISDGQRVNAAVTNAAYLSKTAAQTSTVSEVTINNATESTTKDTGALIVEGGVGVEKNLNVGGNAAVTGTLAVTGNSTLTGDTTITGNLTVNGTQTTLNTSTIESEDNNMLLNKGGNDASADGGGLDIVRTSDNGTFRFDSALTSKWKLGLASAMYEVIVAGLTQTITGIKTFAAALGMAEVSTPATPSAGFRKLYAKTDGIYEIDSSGVEKKLGADGYATTVTSGVAVTLTASSKNVQYFTGTLDQTVILPVTSTLSLWQSFRIVNASTGIIRVLTTASTQDVCYILPTAQSPGSANEPKSAAVISCVSTAGLATSESWSVEYIKPLYSFKSTATSGSTVSLLFSSERLQVFTGTTAQTVKLPSTTPVYHNLNIPSDSFTIVNSSTQILTVNADNNGLIRTIAPNTMRTFYTVSVGGSGPTDWVASGENAADLITAASGNLTSTTLNAALAELQTDIDTRATAAALTAHDGDTTTVHGIADTSLLLTTTGTQVVTNKDIDGGVAANTRRITLPSALKSALDALTRKAGTVWYGTDTAKAYVDNGTNLIAIGSGAGAVNLLSDADAEAGTTGWNTDSVAAATRPSGALLGSGTGITFSTSSSSPIFGVNSFTFAKDASNRQGKMAYKNCTLDIGYRAKVISIRVPYIVSSGTFVAGSSSTDSDAIVYIREYNGSTYTWKEPSSFKFLSNSTTISDELRAEFQTNHDTISFDFVIFCASTSAVAYTLKFDTILISPSTYTYGTPISDLLNSYAGTLTGTTIAGSMTYTANTLYWQRVGDSMRVTGNIRINVVTTAPTGSVYLNLPTGYSWDSTKQSDGGRGTFGSSVGLIGTNQLPLNFVTIVAPNAQSVVVANGTAALGGLLVNGNEVKVDFTIPILGWSSSVQMSDQTDTRVVAAKILFGATTIATTDTQLVFATPSYDTHGGRSANTYVIPVSGTYSFGGVLSCGAKVGAVGGDNYVRMTVNGVQQDFLGFKTTQVTNSITFRIPITGQYKFNAGDIITLFAKSDTNSSVLNTNSVESYITIERISGPSAIAATESVNTRANNNVATTIATTGDTLIPYLLTTGDYYDSHGGWASSIYTVPISGKYRVNAKVRMGNSLSWTVADYIGLFAKVDGATYHLMGNFEAQVTRTIVNGPTIQGAVTLKLTAGQTIRIVANTALTATKDTLAGSPNYNSVEIERVGN